MNLLAKNTWHTVIHPIRSLQLTTLSIKNLSKNISNFSHKARGILKIIVDTNLNVWIPIWIYHATGFKVTSLFGVPGFIEQDGGPLFSTSINLYALFVIAANISIVRGATSRSPKISSTLYMHAKI